MKRLMLGAALLASMLVIGALLIPEGEVVTLQGPDSEGNHHATQLWISEVEGQRYLRAINPASTWLARVRMQPELDLLSSDGTAGAQPIHAVIVDDDAVKNALNAAMAAKYGFANSLACAIADTRTAVAVRLDARGDAPRSPVPKH